VIVVLNKLLCVQSTGGSTGEDEDETQTAETRRNTQHNEQLLDREPAEVNMKKQSLWCLNVKGNTETKLQYYS